MALTAVVVGGCGALVVVAFRGMFDFGDPCLESDSELIAAASAGDAEAVAAELAAGADPGQVVDDESPLGCAAANGDQTVGAMRVLLDRGADPDGPPGPASPLLRSSWNGHEEVVALLLERGADPDRGSPLQGGVAVLSFATGQLPPQRLLSELRGVDPVTVHPLAAVAWRDHHRVARLLLDGGADPDLMVEGVYTPLYAAAARGSERTAQVLLRQGAGPDPQVPEGVRSPARAARIAGYRDLAVLIEEAYDDRRPG
jgi:uncharacterized protein